MSMVKKAFWFITLLSVLVVVPTFWRNHFVKGTRGRCCPFYAEVETGCFGEYMLSAFLLLVNSRRHSSLLEVTEFSARSHPALAFCIQVNLLALCRRKTFSSVSGLYSSFMLLQVHRACRLSGRYGSGCAMLFHAVCCSAGMRGPQVP